jgi:hypothetical protein
MKVGWVNRSMKHDHRNRRDKGPVGKIVIRKKEKWN